MVKTNVYEILKKAYKLEMQMDEATFMKRRHSIEKTYDWLLFAFELCASPYYPRKVRINAHAYTMKLLRQFKV